MIGAQTCCQDSLLSALGEFWNSKVMSRLSPVDAWRILERNRTDRSISCRFLVNISIINWCHCNILSMFAEDVIHTQNVKSVSCRCLLTVALKKMSRLSAAGIRKVLHSKNTVKTVSCWCLVHLLFNNNYNQDNLQSMVGEHSMSIKGYCQDRLLSTFPL